MSTAAPPELAEPAPAPTPEEAAQLAPPPQAAVDPYLVEATVAAVGLPKFLEEKGLRRLHLYQIERAARMGDEIDRKIYLFLGLSEPQEGGLLPPFDFDEAVALVKPEPTDQHIVDVQTAFEEYPDLGMAAIQVYGRVQAYLRSKMPHRVHQSILWQDDSRPSHSEIARWRRLWCVAADPMWVVDSLTEFAVSRDMAQALRDMYPLLWARIESGVDAQLARKKSQQPAYRLTVRKEQQLRTLIQREDQQSRELGITLQAMFAENAAAMGAKQAKKMPSGGIKETSAADRIDMD